MATRTPTVTYAPNGHRQVVKVVWSGLLNGDDGAPVNLPGYPDGSIQFQGTFGAGGSIQLEGNNDDTNYQLITDPQGNDIVKTGADLEQITEIAANLRPRVTAGDGTTNLVATLILRRTP